MENIINCETHGPQEETFVCQHLLKALGTGKKVGFSWASEPGGYAWCAECEEVRIREGGNSGDWNECSEAFAAIKLLCGSCYDRLRREQLF